MAGCGGDKQEEPTGEGINTEVDEPRYNAQGIDYEAAFAAFAPDTIMVTAGEFTVTWAELFFYIRGNINGVFSYFGELPDWAEEISDGLRFDEFLLTSSVADTLEFKVVEYGAALMDVALSEEDARNVKDYFESLAESYGGEEEFLRMIWEEDGCSSRELFEHLVSLSRLVDVIFNELYGKDGELLSDDTLAGYVSEDGYIMAKHILLRHPDEDSDEVSEEAGDEDIDEDNAEESDTLRDKIDNIWILLSEYDGDDFDAFFDELMFEHSEDTGLEANPGGYLFQAGDMVVEFYNAAVELEIGQFSEVVESDFGYHIIYRIPVNFDVTPGSGYRNNDYRTLREVVMMEMFSITFEIWRSSLEIEYTDEFESIALSEIFSVAPAG